MKATIRSKYMAWSRDGSRSWAGDRSGSGALSLAGSWES